MASTVTGAMVYDRKTLKIEVLQFIDTELYDINHQKIFKI
jgi:hypothetical protein